MTHAHHPDHKKAYAGVWIALLVFTVITVWVAYHNYGVFNIVVAMGVATIKAVLVILVFMGLKYDNKTNVVVFSSAFVFLGIFVGLTLSDVIVRPQAQAVVITAVEPPLSSQIALMEELRKPTPELSAHGKAVYAANCLICHGPEGKGNGPAGGAFNPPPRNFTVENFKQGSSPAQMFHTVTKGFGSMPAFSGLSLKDRWAVVHHIRTLAPPNHLTEDTPESLKLIGVESGGTPQVSEKIIPPLPVDFIMKRMTE